MMRSAPFGCLALGLFVLAIVLFPFVLAEVMLTAMHKLGLTPGTGLMVVMGIFFGGMFNIPVKKIPRGQQVEAVPVRLFGVGKVFPRFVSRQTYTIIALNVGGCLIPCGIALWQVVRVLGQGGGAFVAMAVAVGINVVVCYWTSRPVKNVGIAMQPFLPALVAAFCAIVLVPNFAPPVAFAAGVFGPLIGADLLHLGQIKKISTGVASIGGAGTFDGIVLSGLVATLLA